MLGNVESSYVPICKRVLVCFCFLLMSNLSQPVSLYMYKVSSDTSFIVPVAILAASVWIISMSSFSYCVQLSQISLPYSKIGIMKTV